MESSRANPKLGLTIRSEIKLISSKVEIKMEARKQLQKYLVKLNSKISKIYYFLNWKVYVNFPSSSRLDINFPVKKIIFRLICFSRSAIISEFYMLLSRFQAASRAVLKLGLICSSRYFTRLCLIPSLALSVA